MLSLNSLSDLLFVNHSANEYFKIKTDSWKKL